LKDMHIFESLLVYVFNKKTFNRFRWMLFDVIIYENVVNDGKEWQY